MKEGSGGKRREGWEGEEQRGLCSLLTSDGPQGPLREGRDGSGGRGGRQTCENRRAGKGREMKKEEACMRKRIALDNDRRSKAEKEARGGCRIDF